MKPAPVHLVLTREQTFCGKPFARSGRVLRHTAEPDNVTCATCRRSWTKHGGGDASR